tara:strand:- start:3069 stop:3617 length:549 start_codon:yes stop_codon:yes gene_type:complete
MLKLVTSNDAKFDEFKRIGLPVSERICLDLREVKGTSREVAIYKAIEAGEGFLVEDTILSVNGKEIVDIRYHLSELKSVEDAKAEWKVTLAMVKGDIICLAEGVVTGSIGSDSAMGIPTFGFDSYFYPDEQKGYSFSLYELNKMGCKDKFSARERSVRAFLANDVIHIPLRDVPKWDGEYQG